MLRAAQSGDRTALSRLLQPEVDRVYAVCLRMIGRPDAARDVAQDALVKVVRGLPEFDGKAALGTWVTRIAINTCLSWLRTQRRSGQRAIASAQTDEVAADPGEPVPAWSVQWEERRRLVAAALDDLSPEHRAVLVLRDVRGLEYEEIAEVLDVAVGTVKSRLFRARTALREAVEARETAEGPPAGRVRTA